MDPNWVGIPFNANDRARIKDALDRGDSMAYPTETAYALGGNALRPECVERVFQLKGRPKEKALLLLVAGVAGVEQFAREIHPGAKTLMSKFWPGALTLVFFGGKQTPPHLLDDRGTVAMRWSPHPVVSELLTLGGVPLIGTSANRSGDPSARRPDEVRAAFGKSITLGVEGGEILPCLPSTVIDTTVSPFRVVREGQIQSSAIRSALGAAHALCAP